MRVGVLGAADVRSLAGALADCDVMVNAASHRVHLAAMEAALAADCHYVDLGAPYPDAAEQYRRAPAFERVGLVAVLGCGAGPGTTNVLAAWAAAELDAVDTVRCASAGLAVPGDELAVPPVVVRDGELAELEPLAAAGEIVFPEPVGRRLATIYAPSSEVLTLPVSFSAANCDARRSLDSAPAPARTWSAQRVDVTGTREGREVSVTATALTAPHERWGLGGGVVATGSVAAAAVRLIARGALRDRAGALPPEVALRPDDLFAELAERGCRFDITTPTTTSEV